MPALSGTVTLAKFVGTISLGLLTGVSYTISTTTLPPILALPTAQPAHTTFLHLRALTQRHQILLSTLSTSSLIIAYILSPPRRRHPFLLWAPLCVGLAYGKDIYANLKAKIAGRGSEEASGGGSDSGEEDWEVEGAASTGSFNGEVVRDGTERWRGKMMARGSIFAVGWVVSVVGLWGDGALFD